MDKGVIHPI